MHSFFYNQNRRVIVALKKNNLSKKLLVGGVVGEMDLGGWHLVSLLLKQYCPQSLF